MMASGIQYRDYFILDDAIVRHGKDFVVSITDWLNIFHSIVDSLNGS